MLSENIDKIIKECSNQVIVAATKYVAASDLLLLREKGIKDFGENRVDDFLFKYQEMKEYEDITWHFIGTLQTNKVKKMINKVDYLHSLDSLNLANYIDKYRFKELPCFIQVNLTNSQTKHGIKKEELLNFLDALKKYPKVKIVGLMTMTEESQSSEEKYATFRELKKVLESLNNQEIKYLSMGMSGDYEEAIKASSTHLRLGRILFRK